MLNQGTGMGKPYEFTPFGAGPVEATLYGELARLRAEVERLEKQTEADARVIEAAKGLHDGCLDKDKYCDVCEDQERCDALVAALAERGEK